MRTIPYAEAVAVILLLLQLISFAAYGSDKRKAVHGKRRTPERVLLSLAFAAPFGALAGMLVFHHKTRKLRFTLTVPLFALLHIAAAVLIYRRLM
ncbi:MAG: DUF1294 domain-containing protein [Oscillospiraceae bacterium]|nr:DUF1294 domain-containing protein [Oscillospiraceae bacterium]